MYSIYNLHEKRDAEILCMAEVNLQLVVINVRSALRQGRLELEHLTLFIYLTS